MGASATGQITFLVPGQRQSTDATGASGVKASVRVGVARADGAVVRVMAQPGEDVVVLHIANGPVLYLHPEAARDLLRSQSTGTARDVLSRAAGATASDAEVVVLPQLGWPLLEAGAVRGATRGWLGQVVLSTLEVLTGSGTDKLAGKAAEAVTQQLDGAVEAGVYALTPEALLPLKGSERLQKAVPAAADGGALLVLVHGTFVDTVSTFGALWAQHPQTVRSLFAHYGGRVYALDHPTMAASPMANALTLVRALPLGARLHLLTHSRGGLVAEVLARACSGQPLGADELALFAGAGHRQNRADVQALYKEAQAKGLKVQRVVRVACPARGTLLASTRLDAYLSVLKWGLELAGVPVAPQLLNFLHEVARRRTRPEELPGLEAMMPNSPVVQWLNAADVPLEGELQVVAGDLQGDSVGSWVKTLLSDAFYWTDNDLVVQTRSMYGGAPRTGGARFLLDQGAKVSHFNYFANERTVQAVSRALMQAAPAEFAAIGPLSWAGQDASGKRGGGAATHAAHQTERQTEHQAERPAVVILPGILGSHLQRDGQRIWLGFRFVNGLKKLAWSPETAARFTPDGPIGNTYDALVEHLQATHEVIVFSFDWRRPIEDEARRLAKVVAVALQAREASQQPVRLLAHSMGGLVARTLQLEAPEVWARMMARQGARLLMLGTPNAGSWAPMQTLSGDDTFGNALVALGSLFDNRGARHMMAGMPGFIQLQAALLDPDLRLHQASTWTALAQADMATLRERSTWHDADTQSAIYEWGAPPQDVLDQACALRRRLDAQAHAWGADAPKLLMVVGQAAFTPAGFDPHGTEGLVYLNAPATGDGRVALESALLAGVRTWKVNAEHGKLPSEPSALEAYAELLSTGQTQRLERVASTHRSEGEGESGEAISATKTRLSWLRSRPSRTRQTVRTAQPPSQEADVLGLPQGTNLSAQTELSPAFHATALHVSVFNGDLKFISQPLMVGHYRSLVLTGAEGVVDALVGRAMSQSLLAGLYPEATGTHQIFANQRADPHNPFAMARPQAVVVVGLGDEGKLRASELVYTVRQAVLAYAQRVAEQADIAQFELAATLMGSGGQGISAGSAAQLIAQGALQANQALQQAGKPTLSRLVLVEFYLDRASDAWRALQVQAQAAPGQLELLGWVTSGDGALRRSLDSSYRGAGYDLISALTGSLGPNQQPTLEYVLDTRRARTELRAQQAQGTLLKELVGQACHDVTGDINIGRTLFKLLVPVEMEPFLGGTTAMVMELDAGSAAIPWELLSTENTTSSGGDPRPWAIRTQLLRKLRTLEFRAQVLDANTDDSVLVIGEPLCDATRYPPLPGARAEALAVAQQLSASGLAPNKLCVLASGADDARSVISALLQRPYRAVHVAGHGAPGALGGVVLSSDTFLGAAEIKAMRTVPELVFLNCCHLAGRDAALVLQPAALGRYDRTAFAANIAQALIELGVRCVIAAGWAVEDGPAELFATTFYASMLRGERFIDATACAREAAWSANPQGNTWAAYQCYGDPHWSWSRSDNAPQASSLPVFQPQNAPGVGEEFMGVASPVALCLALETLAIRSRFGSVNAQLQHDKLRFLEAQFAPVWGHMGAVAEAFGVAYAQAQASAQAIAWYRTAVSASDGSASFKAAEQLGNELARGGEKQPHLATGLGLVQEGITRLEQLLALQATPERHNLLGSACKRLVLLHDRAGRPAASLKALEKSAAHYAQAEVLAQQTGVGRVFYAALNGISAELRLAFLKRRTPHVAPERWAAAQQSLAHALSEQPDFWSVVGQTELALLQALAQAQLASSVKQTLQSFTDLKARVQASASWDSVYTHARFTLAPYQTVATPPEQRAAQAVLEHLQALAQA
jgi:hypothetical protein